MKKMSSKLLNFFYRFSTASVVTWSTRSFRTTHASIVAYTHTNAVHALSVQIHILLNTLKKRRCLTRIRLKRFISNSITLKWMKNYSPQRIQDFSMVERVDWKKYRTFTNIRATKFTWDTKIVLSLAQFQWNLLNSKNVTKHFCRLWMDFVDWCTWHF